MKKILPIFKNTSGFTLVELMVVIAIIGILAVVALGIFSGAQGSARDARRVAEIDSLAKNIESTRDPQTGFYSYPDARFDTDYPGGLIDPSNVVYCQIGSTTATNTFAGNAGNPATWTGTTCPSNWGSVNGTTLNSVAGSDVTDAPSGTPPTGIRSWKVCATLERSATVFCKSNLIQ